MRDSLTEPRRLLLAQPEVVGLPELRDGDGREAARDSEAQREEVDAEARAHLETEEGEESESEIMAVEGT